MSFHNASNAFHHHVHTDNDSFGMQTSFDFGFDDHLNSLLASDPTLASFPSTSTPTVASTSSAPLPTAAPVTAAAPRSNPQLHQQPMVMPSAADHLIASLLGDDLLVSPTAGGSSSGAVDPAKLAGVPADFEADLFALLPDLFGLASAAATDARTTRQPTPAPEDLPALEPPSPKAAPAPLRAAPFTSAAQSTIPTLLPAASAPALTMPMLPSMAPQPMVPMLAAAAPTTTAAPPAGPQLYSVINVTGPNNQATTLLVPVSGAAAPAPPSAPAMFPAAAAPTPAALPAVAQTAAASLSAYHQHRLQEAAAAAAAAAASAAGGPAAKPNSLAAVKSAVAAAAAAAAATAGSPTAGLKPLLPAAPTTAAPVTAKKPESSSTKDTSAAAKRKLEIPDEVLEYPSHLIPLDAPIQKKRKRAGEPLEPEPTPADDDESPETAKRIKNTLSARHSRARRAAKMNFLESRVVDLEAENEQLKAELAEARRAVAELKAQMLGAAKVPVAQAPPQMVVRGMPPRI